MGKLKKGTRAIFLCEGKKCCRYNEDIKARFKKLIAENKMDSQCEIQKMKCQGMCKKAPVVYLSSVDVYKKEVCKKKADKIFEKYIK